MSYLLVVISYYPLANIKPLFRAAKQRSIRKGAGNP
jgi:hypothetical protein